MPEKETFHEQVQVHPFHHPGHPGIPPNGYPLHIPSAFVFHPPLPSSVDQRAHDGRYLWDPSVPPSTFHHPPSHG